jgi:hypothetical protein
MLVLMGKKKGQPNGLAFLPVRMKSGDFEKPGFQ